MAVLALTVVMAAPVAGQTVATNFEELRLKVKTGDTVYITDDSGKPEQEARILELTTSSLAVTIEGVRRDVVESRVRRIRQRLPDSRKNGALIGSLVGAAGSTAGAVAMASPAGSCNGGCVGANVLIGGGVGALVGLGIDALIQGRKDIYVGAPRQSFRDAGARDFALSHAEGCFAETQNHATGATGVTQAAVTGPFSQRALAASVGRSLERWPLPSHGARFAATQQAVQTGGWIRRHPVLFGALVGAAAGAGIGYALGQDCTGQEIEPCSSRAGAAAVGAGLFAGGGALVGFLVDRATR